MNQNLNILMRYCENDEQVKNNFHCPVENCYKLQEMHKIIYIDGQDSYKKQIVFKTIKQKDFECPICLQNVEKVCKVGCGH